ncbi:Mor transcription activator family protein [Levilactobacillus paucivorans]|uniref:Mor transcription activator family protein n=1 Tax=Levilactobacillus paucivorans TaxID=616990 RepID=UPI000ABA8265|nr:Mor transcription activator family protein [Levilactobacillus paucivorans]
MDGIENWHAVYQKLARVVGVEATKKMCAYFGGSQITFPRRLLDRKKEATAIRRAYKQGGSVVTLAHDHNYSSRTIRRILAKPEA